MDRGGPDFSGEMSGPARNRHGPMRKGDWRKIYGGYKTKLCHSALPDTSSSPPPMHSGPPQHPHSHPHHEPSRHIQRPNATVLANVTVTGLDIVNPRILDASIRDATERLSNEQKAEVLIHAMNLLRLAKCVFRCCL